jgi:5-methylcytosine-specific restriction endonuclease McrA
MGLLFVKRKPVELEPRKAMTAARRRRILAKSDGHCSYPDCEVTEGLEIDHQIPLALGGKDTDENLFALCRHHHGMKTRLDVKMIAKAKRIVRKNSPETRKPARLQSRGFDKTLTRRFNGKVEKRT